MRCRAGGRGFAPGAASAPQPESLRSARGNRRVRRAPAAAARSVAVGDAALDRRRRADGRGRPLDQHGRPRPPDPGLPGLRGTLPLPGAQPAALAQLACRLRDVAADPAAPDRLLLRPRPRAGHARGAQPLRRRLARRRPQPAADAEAAGAARRDRADPGARRPARARLPAPVRDLTGRGRARRSSRDPALRRRSRARVAGDEDRQPARLRRRGTSRTPAASTSPASTTCSRPCASCAARRRS